MIKALSKGLWLNISMENFQIRAEQMRTLVRAYPSMIVANMVMAPLLAWLMWHKIEHSLLLSWVALLYTFHMLEIRHWLNYPKEILSIQECKRWQRQFLLSDSLVGALWGSAGIFMFVPGDPVFQAFLLCIMMGMAAGAVAGNLVFPLSQQSYVAWVMLPILGRMLLQDNREYYLLSAMVGIFLIFIMKVGRDQSRFFELSIRSGLENSELLRSLQRSNEQLAFAQREARAGMWDWDVVNGTISWSDEMFALHGLDRRSSIASMESWRNTVFPDDLKKAEDNINAAVHFGGAIFDEYRILLPDERVRWIALSGNCARNERNETVRMTGMCFDVTVQKEAQQRALRAEIRYQVLVDHAAVALFVHDFEANIIEVNRQTCEMLGYSRAELLQMNVADISPSFDLTDRKRRWEQLKVGTPDVLTSLHRRKDGSTFPVEVRLASLLLGDEKLIMALVSDITERVRFENALQRSEERYRTFAEKLPLGITVLQDGLIKYVNQAITGLLGYSVEELQDKPFPLLIHEEDRPRALDLHRRRMQGEDVPMTFIVRMIRKDGDVRQWELNASTTEWDGKRSSLAIVADITERVAMEEALRDSFRLLEEKELSKTRFLAAAGHDLRQPVAAANLFVDALKNTAPNQRQSELINKLDQSMAVFSDLLERLLDISKFDAGLVKPVIASFDLIELFNWLEQNFADTARERQLDFRLYFPLNRSLIIRTDIGLLQSVMMNLVSNAIKFTEQGGVLVSARVHGDSVLMQVWDTGSGIAEADMPHIYDEFYQSGNPQRNRKAGLGLGLSICQRAMALLGGDIVCRSTHGRGSVFEFNIQLNKELNDIASLPDNSAHPPLANDIVMAGKRVVVLEDDELVSNGLLNLLQGLGAQVLQFHSAEDALRHQDIINADFFIVDYSLGGELSGIEFVQNLQGRMHKPIHAVIVTGETSSRFIDGISGLHWPVLHKPISYSKLATSLSRYKS